MAIMEIDDILKILPHRYPMLLVDRVLEIDMANKRIVGIKNLTVNEPFFQGHFPGRPIMPGVLQLEAMAQLSGILLNQILKREGLISYFVAINDAKFRRILRPGDQMVMEMIIDRFKLSTVKVHGVTRVDQQVACEAEMMFRLAEA